MDFKMISNEELNLRLEKIARTERKITHIILLHINEVDSRGLHLKMGFESLYSYLVKALHYSESAAYRRIQAARLLRTVPEVAEKIESGTLNLSQLTQVQKCLKEEKKKGMTVTSQKITEVLVAMERKNTSESEKILASEFGHVPKIQEITKPQRDDSVRMEITLTREQFECLKQAQALLSHQCPDGSWAEVLTQLAKKFNQSRMGKTAHPEIRQNDESREDGTVKVAQSNTASKKFDPAQSEAIPKNRSEPYRPAISIKTKRYLLTKAHHTCEYVDASTRRKCSAKHRLEVDHVKPLALGGTHEIENLRILCQAHNQWAAKNSGLLPLKP